MTRVLPVFAAAAVCALSQPRAFTAADYEHAEKFMGYSTTPLVLRSGVRPSWLDPTGKDDRFWYRVTTEKGAEFLLIDPASGSRQPAFDHANVAAALSAGAGTAYEAAKLPFNYIEVARKGQAVLLMAPRQRWDFDVAGA